MTKHRDVNKYRRKENCKMAALIRQANKRVRNGQKARDKKEKRKKERIVEKKRKREKNKPKPLSEKNEKCQ